MPNYQNGKIYKIVCDEAPELVYYGSTCVGLSKRMGNHREDYRNNNGVKKSQILKYPSAIIVLVELFPCNSKEELFTRERWWIENNRCVNEKLPIHPRAEYLERNHEKRKKMYRDYYQNNIDEIKQKRKQIYELNRQAINQHQRDYYEANKANMLVAQKRYREANNAKINEKTICECGAEVVKRNINRHKETNSHKLSLKV